MAEAIEKEGIHLAASNEGKRVQAVELARRTIEFAAELGAQAVVLHLGTVESEKGALAAQKEALWVFELNKVVPRAEVEKGRRSVEGLLACPCQRVEGEL